MFCHSKNWPLAHRHTGGFAVDDVLLFVNHEMAALET